MPNHTPLLFSLSLSWSLALGLSFDSLKFTQRKCVIKISYDIQALILGACGREGESNYASECN